MAGLETCKPFRSLKASEQDALRKIAVERTFAAGDHIFKEGDSGDGIYAVKDGAVEISVAMNQNVRRVFAKLGPGEMFGEMAVLEFKPRSASAIATVKTQVYFIPRDALLSLLEKSPALSLELLRDISQRLRDFNRRYIDETIQAERLAVIGRFARSIIHDLKNPLSIISMSSELIAMQPAKPEVRENAQARIRKQVERISDLISDILDFTNGSQARTFVGNTNYAAFVQSVIEEIRADVEPKRVLIELQSPPSVDLPIDPKRLRRVFHNLIHNASDAMSRGGTVFVRFLEENNELITEIEDTGPGIAPEIAGTLFEAFATFGKEHGTGLGLSICKKIVEDHHGRIWARNQPARGAVFAFTLPLPTGRS
ncbi:MAG TPA: HAMP domain-containing sensor histidine kinase [Candidatus Angelobacter sp.]|nr:HAMP domain-containing sensor histidine kinase [Candidatus Angelobacter sp.]